MCWRGCWNFDEVVDGTRPSPLSQVCCLAPKINRDQRCNDVFDDPHIVPFHRTKTIAGPMVGFDLYTIPDFQWVRRGDGCD